MRRQIQLVQPMKASSAATKVPNSTGSDTPSAQPVTPTRPQQKAATWMTNTA